MAAVGNVYYTFVPQKLSSGNVTDYTKTGDQTVDEMTWNVPGNWYATGALRIGGKSITDVDRVITGKTAMGDAIAQIVITHTGVTSDNLKLNSITVTAASDDAFTQDVESKTVVANTDFTYAKNTEGTITITPTSGKWAKNAYYKIAFNVTNSNGSNYAFVLNKIEFYSYAEGGATPATKTIYCKNVQSWWTQDGAAVGVHYWGGATSTTWPGVRMDSVPGEAGTWKYDVPTDITGIMFVRVNGSGDIADWGAKTANLTLPTDEKNLYTITSENPVWGDPGVTGEWSVYGSVTPVDPPTPVDSMTVYFVNTLDWANVNAFVWPAEGNAYKAWPGEAAKKETEKINEKDVYAYTFPASFVNVIFNNGTAQTADLKWVAAKPYFVPGKANDQGKYEGTWYAKSEIPVPATPTLANGYYLVGDKYNWTPAAERLFAENAGAAGEYVLAAVTLAAGDSLKVVKVENDAIATWYPGGDNYVVDADHAGVKDIYFRPDGQGGSDWYSGTIYIVKNPAPVENGIWKVTSETAVAANTVYVDNNLLKLNSVYATTLKENARTIAGEEFTHAIQVRVDAWPTTENVNGTEKAGSTPLILTAKEDIEVLLYYNRQTTSSETGAAEENDNKDVWVFDHTAITTPITGEFTVVGTQDDKKYVNATKKLTLTKGHTYTIAAKGTTLQLHGVKYGVPAPAPADPTVAVKGSMNAWGDSIPFELAQDKKSATLTVPNIKKGNYEFKMIINGEWRSNGYTYHRGFTGAAGITGNNDANMVLQLDADGQYTFTWTFANDSLGIIFPEKPANVLENGYYLVGTQINNWTPVAKYLFGVNPDNAQEYKLTATLTEGDSIKVVKVVDDAITTWYPEGDNYVVDAAHAGENKDIYFSPDYKQDWAEFGGYFWTGSNETPVVKYCEKPAGHLGDPNFGDANGRILLTIAKGTGNNVVVKIKNNNAAGNTKTGLNYLWVNAANSTGVVRYGNGTHTEADVEEVSVEVVFNEPQESYNFINIHWAYSGWEGEWAIDGLQVTAAELCDGTTPQPATKFYITGDGETFGNWNPAAIAVTEDSYTFQNLAAGNYKMKVTVDGTWNTAKGYDDLTVKAEGLSKDNDGNICFTLAETGNVTVTYTAEVFKLEGNFYVKPAGETKAIKLVPGVWNVDGAKFAAVTWKAGETMESSAAVISDWFVGTDTVVGQIPVDADSIAFARFAAGAAVPSLNMSDIWNHSDKLAIDPSLIYTITEWGKDYSPGYWGEAPQPVEAEWFLAGDMTDWQNGKISFKNGDIKVTLADAGRTYAFKIVKVEGENMSWYGNNGTMTREYNQDWVFDSNEQENGKLTADVAGEYTFKMVVDGIGTPHVSVTYPELTGLQLINADNVAVKAMINGQIVIIRGEHIFTTTGQMIK